jgi:hypothetical protein
MIVAKEGCTSIPIIADRAEHIAGTAPGLGQKSRPQDVFMNSRPPFFRWAIVPLVGNRLRSIGIEGDFS